MREFKVQTLQQYAGICGWCAKKNVQPTAYQPIWTPQQMFTVPKCQMCGEDKNLQNGICFDCAGFKIRQLEERIKYIENQNQSFLDTLKEMVRIQSHM